MIAGPQRRSRKVSEKEKKIVAYHEAGHALVALLLPGSDPLHKITIIPRGMAGGYTVTLPEEDRTLHSREYFLTRLPMMLGGRVSEEIVFGDITTGAADDLDKATTLVRQMICKYGMSETIGPVSFGKENGMVFLGRDLGEERDYSEDTARLIDGEIKRILGEAYQKAKIILTENRARLDLLTKTLLEKETLDAQEVHELLSLPSLETPPDGIVKPAQM